jgi:hypothetical protein
MAQGIQRQAPQELEDRAGFSTSQGGRYDGYESQASDLTKFIRSIIPDNPQILKLRDAWGLLKIEDFKARKYKYAPSFAQADAALRDACIQYEMERRGHIKQTMSVFPTRPQGYYRLRPGDEGYEDKEQYKRMNHWVCDARAHNSKEGCPNPLCFDYKPRRKR